MFMFCVVEVPDKSGPNDTTCDMRPGANSAAPLGFAIPARVTEEPAPALVHCKGEVGTSIKAPRSGTHWYVPAQLQESDVVHVDAPLVPLQMAPAPE